MARSCPVSQERPYPITKIFTHRQRLVKREIPVEVRYQVGQVVLRDTMTLQQQWQEHLEQLQRPPLPEPGLGILAAS